MNLRVCGELQVDSGCTEEIQGDEAMREDLVPEVQWEFRVCGAQTRDEVVFEGFWIARSEELRRWRPAGVNW